MSPCFRLLAILAASTTTTCHVRTNISTTTTAASTTSCQVGTEICTSTSADNTGNAAQTARQGLKKHSSTLPGLAAAGVQVCERLSAKCLKTEWVGTRREAWKSEVRGGGSEGARERGSEGASKGARVGGREGGSKGGWEGVEGGREWR